MILGSDGGCVLRRPLLRLLELVLLRLPVLVLLRLLVLLRRPVLLLVRLRVVRLLERLFVIVSYSDGQPGGACKRASFS